MSQPRIESKVISRIPSIRLEDPLSFLEKARAEMSEMDFEAPDHLIYSAAVSDALMTYATSVPEELKIAMNVVCAGVGLKLTANRYYYVPRYVGATLPPGGLPVYAVGPDGRSEEVLRLDRYGRAGGDLGWDKYRDLVAFVLASFTHNFVPALIGFVERVRLPFSGAWKLPNIVLSETVAPKQAIPPASFVFTFIPPAFSPAFIVEYSSETPVTFWFELWDADKRDVARVNHTEESTGDVKLVVVFPGALLSSGYFNINVVDAPKGIVVRRVLTIPPAIK
ncbi:MAG: hypothetical protein QW632_04460 [Ignisphaera sp.]